MTTPERWATPGEPLPEVDPSCYPADAVDLPLLLAPPPEDGCCARPEGHEGPCVWKCSNCGATGNCMACGGDGEDGSGLPDTCMECDGSGQCPYGCDEGWCQE